MSQLCPKACSYSFMERNGNLSGFAKRYLQDFLATVSFEACSVIDHLFSHVSVQKALTSCSRPKKKTCVFNAFYIFPHATPAPSPLHITSHNSLCGIKHYYISEIRARVRSLQQSFPEGIIKPYKGTSVTIGNVCCYPICYRISSHFG